MFIRLRQWLIRKLAGDMGVVLNAKIYIEEDGRPFVDYASINGGMCSP